VVDGPSEVVVHPVDLHVDLVQLPLSVMVRKHRLDALVPDLYCKHRTEPVPPEPHGFEADLDPSLVKKILNIAERQREPKLQHHRQTGDLWARLKVAEKGAFCHPPTL
jgi:hypothetical protein